jgi:hypothetical protein
MKILIKKCLAKVFQPLIGAINDSRDSRDSLVAENQKLCLEMLRIQISENPTSAKDTVTKMRGVATGVVIG